VPEKQSAPQTCSSVGKRVRFERIFAEDSKTVIFAMDHGVERGPGVFSAESVNPRNILPKVVEAGFDAMMLSKGVARSTNDIWRNKLGLILKISGKSELRPKENQSLQSPIGSVRDAVALGADAVASTVYWGSKYEDLMLRRFVRTQRECEEFGFPILQLAYPRVEGKDNNEVEIVSYASRLAFETGADAIKTYYTGDRASFSEVVKAAGGVPVLLSGGQMNEQPLGFLKDVENVMAAGAKGVVVGRNVFQHKDPVTMGKAIIHVVHDEWPAGKAANFLN
jgi:fructose-bisphosphate aldolase, class I